MTATGRTSVGKQERAGYAVSIEGEEVYLEKGTDFRFGVHPRTGKAIKRILSGPSAGTVVFCWPFRAAA